ncbi:alpha/beta hydrolase [Sphingomonas sp. Leaf21]|uniref:alpha/beta hydrolase n=1 Tax=Sphingomonas sp. Leaf21 TaxID=2876550 RepID=UPI001E4BB337|nr:alpha/beta hydrolase fold domain-containing protein [Sphingomonas sp. Leaf21]
MPHDIIPASAARAVRLSTVAEHPVLDPVVQSFLDRWQEGADRQGEGATTLVTLRPARGDRPLPLFLYLEVASDRREDRLPALQALAEEAGVAILRYRIADADLSGAAALVAAMPLADRGPIAVGGDGLGAAIALALVVARPVGWSIRLLILATPTLGDPSDVAGTEWLDTDRAEDLAGKAAAIVDPVAMTVDPFGFPRTLLLTAEADPFAEPAEALGRRLMGQGVDLSAARVIGMIHDFTWLPALRDAAGTIDAMHAIAAALRDHLHTPAFEEPFPC